MSLTYIVFVCRPVMTGKTSLTLTIFGERYVHNKVSEWAQERTGGTRAGNSKIIGTFPNSYIYFITLSLC